MEVLRAATLLQVTASAIHAKCSPDERGPEVKINDAFFDDIWGYRVNWRLSEDGWDDEKRLQMLNLQARNELQPELVPELTERGYKKVPIPDQLYKFIKEQRIGYPREAEPCGNNPHQNCFRIDADSGKRVPRKNVELIRIKEPDLFQTLVNEELKEVLEEWVGINLQPSQIYGIRRYLNGSWLSLHVDKLDTHVVSAILQVDQKVDKAWPLFIIDNHCEKTAVYLEPGEMVLYESARVLHGRMEPLNGDFYDNLFVHFRPKKKWYNTDFDFENLPSPIITREDL